MVESKLPPILSKVHHALLTSSDPKNQQLRKELDVLSGVVQHVEIHDPGAPGLREIKQLQMAITKSGGKVCECCGRPF